MKARDFQIHIRVDPEVRQWLRKTAYQRETNITAYVVGLLRNQMETEKPQEATKQTEAANG